MTGLARLLAELGPPVAGHAPWPRHGIDETAWRDLVVALAEAPAWTLLGLWAEIGRVHAALRDEEDGSVAVVSLHCPAGRFPSLAAVRPSAIRLERAIQDLFGLVAEGLDDPRPWLDHDRWERRLPMSADPAASLPAPAPYAFLPVEGAGLHEIPVGPVHAGIIEPGHFRFTANGETVVRLEARLGYVHKGIEALMAGRTPDEAARLAARISGDSTVAHSLGFAMAVEAATGIVPPPRAALLRALMAELERIANHVGDVGAICNDAAFPFMQSHCAILREGVLEACATAFGHRLMMDRVVPGGTAVDLSAQATDAIRRAATQIAYRLPDLVALYEQTGSLQDRTVGTGVVSAALAHRFGAGGHVGRASGRAVDARRSPGYPPYDDLALDVPTFVQGDVDARVRLRLREIEQSLDLIRQILDRLEPGDVRVPVPARAGEGMALIEAFRGELLAWVRLGPDGRVLRAHHRDASWFQWPLLEAAIEGNIVADFPLCNKSFNCSYAGHDL